MKVKIITSKLLLSYYYYVSNLFVKHNLDKISLMQKKSTIP